MQRGKRIKKQKLVRDSALQFSLCAGNFSSTLVCGVYMYGGAKIYLTDDLRVQSVKLRRLRGI